MKQKFEQFARQLASDMRDNGMEGIGDAEAYDIAEGALIDEPEIEAWLRKTYPRAEPKEILANYLV
jgi:hypothetical protein